MFTPAALPAQRSLLQYSVENAKHKTPKLSKSHSCCDNTMYTSTPTRSLSISAIVSAHSNAAVGRNTSGTPSIKQYVTDTNTQNTSSQSSPTRDHSPQLPTTGESTYTTSVNTIPDGDLKCKKYIPSASTVASVLGATLQASKGDRCAQKL